MQAAIREGYSEKTAGQIGEQNLKKLEIADAIAAAKGQRLLRNVEVAAAVSEPLLSNVMVAEAVAEGRRKISENLTKPNIAASKLLRIAKVAEAVAGA